MCGLNLNWPDRTYQRVLRARFCRMSITVCRGAASVGLTTLVAVCLTACGPQRVGQVGIGVDAQGRPVGFVQVCTGHVDRARLFAGTAADNDNRLGEWNVEPDVTNASTWSLERGGAGWTAPKPLGALTEGAVYSLHVDARNNYGTAGSVLFTVSDLKAMSPGQVRYYDYRRSLAGAPAPGPSDSPAGQAIEENAFMKVASEAKFKAESCSQLRART
jgi:hypothetical protein